MKKKVKPKKDDMPSGDGGRKSTSTNSFTDEFNQVKPGDNPNNGEIPLTQLPVNKQIMGKFNEITERRILRKQALWDMPNSTQGLEDARNMGINRLDGTGSPFGSAGETTNSMNQNMSEKHWEQLWNRFLRTLQLRKRKPEGGNTEEISDVMDSGETDYMNKE